MTSESQLAKTLSNTIPRDNRHAAFTVITSSLYSSPQKKIWRAASEDKAAEEGNKTHGATMIYSFQKQHHGCSSQLPFENPPAFE